MAFALLVLAIPVALLTTNIRFAASEARVYDYSVRTYDAADVSRIPESELLRANREIVSYLTAPDAGPLYITVTNANREQQSLFNARETAHMADVRDLFQALFKVNIFAIALTLTVAMALLASSPARVLTRALLYGSIFTTGLVIATGGLAYAGFDSAWRQFHFLAFTNDLWMLDPTRDHLIQMFPRDFWFDITMLIGAFTLLQAFAIASVSALHLYLTRSTAEGAERPDFPERRSMEPRPRIPPPRPRRLAH